MIAFRPSQDVAKHSSIRIPRIFQTSVQLSRPKANFLEEISKGHASWGARNSHRPLACDRRETRSNLGDCEILYNYSQSGVMIANSMAEVTFQGWCYGELRVSSRFWWGRWSVPLAAGSCSSCMCDLINCPFCTTTKNTNLQKPSPAQQPPVAFNREQFYCPYPA
jgi:hypothetical protein